MADQQDTEQAAAPADDPKARMRELLDRKKQGLGAGPQAGANGRGGVGHAAERAGGKREFRRKSS